MEQLTQRQEKVLEYIESCYAKQGISPSFAEIAAHFCFKSNNAVTDYLKVLEKKGYLEYRRNLSRSIVPRRVRRIQAGEGQGIPLIGAIAAGAPIEAVENVETYITSAEAGLDNLDNDRFALRVKGDSMVGRGIHDGDIVIVRQQKSVGPHEVAAVRIGTEATLKYVRSDRAYIRLVADNPTVKTLVLTPADDFEVLGKAIGLVRNRI